jgi:c-di-GMP-binding flagellar brake protein YcgR
MVQSRFDYYELLKQDDGSYLGKWANEQTGSNLEKINEELYIKQKPSDLQLGKKYLLYHSVSHEKAIAEFKGRSIIYDLDEDYDDIIHLNSEFYFEQKKKSKLYDIQLDGQTQTKPYDPVNTKRSHFDQADKENIEFYPNKQVLLLKKNLKDSLYDKEAIKLPQGPYQSILDHAYPDGPSRSILNYAHGGKTRRRRNVLSKKAKKKVLSRKANRNINKKNKY